LIRRSFLLVFPPRYLPLPGRRQGAILPARRMPLDRLYSPFIRSYQGSLGKAQDLSVIFPDQLPPISSRRLPLRDSFVFWFFPLPDSLRSMWWRTRLFRPNAPHAQLIQPPPPPPRPPPLVNPPRSLTGPGNSIFRALNFPLCILFVSLPLSISLMSTPRDISNSTVNEHSILIFPCLLLDRFPHLP